MGHYKEFFEFGTLIFKSILLLNIKKCWKTYSQLAQTQSILEWNVTLPLWGKNQTSNGYLPSMLLIGEGLSFIFIRGCPTDVWK